MLLEGFVNVYRCLQNVADLEVAFVAKAWLGRRGLDLEPRVEGVSDATSNQEVELLVQQGSILVSFLIIIGGKGVDTFPAL